MSTHMFQEVLVVHPSSTELNLSWSGSHPIRYFQPIKDGAKLDDTLTDGG